MRVVFAVIGALIIFLISLLLLSQSREAFFEKTAEQFSRFKTYKPYVFDINDLLVDPNDPDTFSISDQFNYYFSGTDPQFCKDIRRCIEMNLEGNQRCVISYKSKPGVTFSPDTIYAALMSCPIVDIKEELYGGLGRKICKFKGNVIQGIEKIREDNSSIINYEPYIHNCYLPTELGTKNIFDSTDMIYYLYSGRGREEGYDFENGGTVRIVVTNVSIKDDPDATCSFSLYVCGQSAIAASEDETAVEIFKTIQNLPESELYYNETIVWGGPPPEELVADWTAWFYCNLLFCGFFPLACLIYPDAPSIVCGSPPTLPVGYNIYGYYPRVYEFEFDGTCKDRGTCKEALIDAIDAGLWEWSKSHYDDEKSLKYFKDAYYPDIRYVYFSYSPIESIGTDDIDFTSNCWKRSYENSNVYERTRLNYDGDDVFVDSSSLKHIFYFDDFNLQNRIRMVLGIKKIFITAKPYHIRIDIPFPIDLLPGIPDYFEVTSSNLRDVQQSDPEKLGTLEPRVILVLDPITFCSE
jgi:hypothetical protein